MANGAPGTRLTAQDDEMIAQLYRMSKSINEIAGFTGFSWTTVKAHLMTMGLLGCECADGSESQLKTVLEDMADHLAGIERCLSAMAFPCGGGDCE